MRGHSRLCAVLALAAAVALCWRIGAAASGGTVCVERAPMTEAERYLCSGLAKSEKGERAAAVEDYQHALALDPNLPEVHLMLGNEYVERKNYSRAVEEFDIYLRAVPDNPRGWSNRGAAHFRQGDLIAAREDIDRAIELEPRDPSLRENRIATAMASKDTATVIRDASLLLERFPPKPEWLSARGRALAAEEKYREALADFEWQTRLRPDAGAYLNCGLVLLALSEPRAAVQSLSKALKLDPELAEAYLKRCLARYQLQQYKEGIPDCDEFVKREPDDNTGYYTRALLRSRAGDQKGAIVDYRRAAELATSTQAAGNAWYGVGVASERAGLLEGAREAYQQALSITPDHAQAKAALEHLMK